MKKIWARAPSRLDLAGGTLDLPFFAEREKGATLNIGIKKFGYVSVVKNNKQLEINSLNYGRTVKINFPIKYGGDLDLLKAAIKRTGFKEKATIMTFHEMKPHSRLGTSSSISVAMLGALMRYQGKKINKIAIADLATMLERQELHMDNGPQDQYGAALGGCNMLRFNGPKTTVEQLKLKDYVIFELEKNIMLCSMDSEEVAGDVNHETVEGYEKGDERVVGAIKNIKQITYDMYHALKKGDLISFAELLNEETKNRERLNKDIVTPMCQKYIKIGLKSGALSAKILGAGAGGTIMFYAKEGQRENLRRALEKAGGSVFEFRFDHHGLVTWEENS